ncbi:MAG: coproporphyrinogen III oxidase, partial [Caulobacter sp. 32-67-35]
MSDHPPLGVYVHWPYCARICPYCDFNVVRDRGRTAEQAQLADAIVADLIAQRALTGPRRLLSIFFGGGTPSLMDPAQVARVIETARRLWSPVEDLEISLEANPTDAEAGRFPALALEDVLAMGPEHVSPYQLTIEAGTAFDRAVGRGQLIVPDEDRAHDLFETTQTVLEAAGFDAYEVSNHAKGEAARSRHNLVYWRGQDYVGVGPGAHGRLSLAEGRVATTAHRKIVDYIAAVRDAGVGFERETLNSKEAAEERLLLGLRIDDGVPFHEVAVLGLSADAAKV